MSVVDQLDLDSPLQLRGEHETFHPLLDWIPQFDERSRRYAVIDTIDEDVKRNPRSFTWRVPFRKFQGETGRCVQFGFVHDLAARPKMVSEAKCDEIVNKNLIYWPAQEIDKWEGGEYPGAPEPHYAGTSVLAGAKVSTSLGYYHEYRWAFSLKDLILSVGFKGPAVVGTDWFEAMFYPDAGGFVRPDGALVGGHSYCIFAVDVQRKFFWAAQSWEDWGIDDRYGVGSTFKIAFDDWGNKLIEGAEVCIPLGRMIT